MEKRKAILLFVVLLVAAALISCSAQSEGQQQMAQIQSANTAAALLAQYDNVLLSYAYPDGYQYSVFVEDDTFLLTDADHAVTTLFTPKEQCETGFEDGVEYFHRYLNPFGADLGASWRESAFLLGTTSLETVTASR